GYEIASAALSPDGRRVVTGAEHEAILWDADTAKPLLTLKHDGHVKAAAISADGKRVLTGLYGEMAMVRDADSGKQIQVLKGKKGGVEAVACSSDDKHTVTSEEGDMMSDRK